TMPFPSENLHSLSHVRYTPHESWVDTEDAYRNPYQYLASREPISNSIYMLRDAARYIPSLNNARYVKSYFEVKTVLVKNEVDDGRPILCRNHYGLKNLHLVM